MPINFKNQKPNKISTISDCVKYSKLVYFAAMAATGGHGENKNTKATNKQNTEKPKSQKEKKFYNKCVTPILSSTHIGEKEKQRNVKLRKTLP